MLLVWGLPVVLLRTRFPTGYEVDTFTNAKALELMHEHRHPPANDNERDAA